MKMGVTGIIYETESRQRGSALLNFFCMLV
jgi:hypothetical protein